MEEEVKNSAKHPQEFAIALRSSIKTSWIMPLKEFFDSSTMMSQPLFCDGAWRFHSIRKRCNHLYMLNL
ncbi:hypothetical protein [Candidatus Midichloria mitochondrii]|uniref:Uncharacterized protein n=1 Tax=Midichloria mitochondrii (strain IricVA) TaxID=696127 RepID=F7XWR2_MIDMI|nr:hypothetical protein [Candidatus Midichloria mitochondrii]AEI89111.1 hypothetical protein midi_00821 [Candidatus Midichloria mitochondrii IricVA]